MLSAFKIKSGIVVIRRIQGCFIFSVISEGKVRFAHTNDICLAYGNLCIRGNSMWGFIHRIVAAGNAVFVKGNYRPTFGVIIAVCAAPCQRCRFTCKVKRVHFALLRFFRLFFGRLFFGRLRNGFFLLLFLRFNLLKLNRVNFVRQ